MNGRVVALGLVTLGLVWAQGCGSTDSALFQQGHDVPPGDSGTARGKAGAGGHGATSSPDAATNGATGPGSGGVTESGGVAGSSGASPAGGMTANGGASNTGGAVMSGGSTGSGGSMGSGGAVGTGGSGSGGKGTGGAPSASCMDGIKNGNETDVDCGGSCPACIQGQRCAAPADCENPICAKGICQAASCADKLTNGSETGVDCGGTCPPCVKGQPCLVATDCASQICVSGVCGETSCSDGIRNGAETSVDCGGGCPCRVGSLCTKPADCASGSCITSAMSGTGVCGPASTCMNGMRDGTETAVDCGGASCTKCPAGKSCEGNADCATYFCTNKACAACNVMKCPKSPIPSYTPCCTSAGACGTGISMLCL